MTIYNLKLKHSGATQLYTPLSRISTKLTRGGAGTNVFNLVLKSTVVAIDYILTESLQILMTEDGLYLEIE
jgi:hypothetical protein